MPGNPGNFIGDSLYNQRLIEILRNYEKVDLLNQHSFTNMLGGTRNRKMILSGDTSYDNEANFGMRGTATGGRANKIKKTGVAKALRTFGRALKPLGKNLRPIKQALGNRVVQEIDGFDGRVAQDINPQEQVAEMYEMPEAEVDYTYGLPKLPGGRAYNQKKKGLSKLIRTVGMAVKPLNKNLKPIKEAMMKKAVEVIEASGHPKSTLKKRKSKVGGAKSARGAIVSKVMREQGLGLGAASKYVKDNGLY